MATSETPEVDYDYAQAKRRSTFVESLRQLADFLEQHPQVPAPAYVTMNAFVTKDEMSAAARLGSWSKEYYSDWFSLCRTFGEDLKLELNISREQVCRRVVSGMQHVPERPAVPAHEEEVVTWICDDVALLGGK